MRTDSSLSNEVSQSSKWKNQPASNGRLYEMYERRPGGSVVGHSQSGHERNHFFVNDRKGRFIDQSIFSGADSICDSRTNVVWDFDGDGWQDLAVVNANYPHLQIFRNQMQELPDVESNQFVALRLVGGNDTAQASSQWSNRDAAGALIRITSAGLPQIIRAVQLGEGFAAQNSATKLIGVGNQQSVDIEIVWPSGKSTRQNGVAAGTLLIGYENAQQADGEHFVLSDYVQNRTPIPEAAKVDQVFALDTRPSTDKPFRLYISMATWCQACKTAHPQMQTIQNELGDQVEMFGFPVDHEDTAQKLANYMALNSPAYKLLDQVVSEDRKGFRDAIIGVTNSGALPSSILTDENGKILFSGRGVPTVSEIRNAIK